MIAEFKDGQRVYGGQFLVADMKKGTTTASKRYLTVLLQDSTGLIEAKKWDFEEEDEIIFAKGNIVSVDGEVISYRDALQMKIFAGNRLSSENVDWSYFVPSAPVPLEELEKKIKLYVDSISDKDIKDFLSAVLENFKERFLTWPAAVRNHHNYVSGLLYHSITMADMALELCKVYPSLHRDFMLAGTLIHDLGKTIELSGPNATAFTLEGKLLGHISIGQAEIRKIAKEIGYFDYDLGKWQNEEEKKALFHKKEIAVTMEHVVLSHHSKPEFGSPVPPLTREALAIAMIDDIDAKMMILDKAFVGVAPGEFTQKIVTMDDRYFYLPVYSKPQHIPGLRLDKANEDIKE